jgi:endoglucanase
MKPPTTTARRAALAVAGSLALTMAALAPTVAGAAEDHGGLAGSDLWLNPYSTTLEAAQSLSGQARADTQLLGSIPSGNWITQGTPAEAQAAVDEIVDAASARGEMPLIVAYNLPFRDCAQYSAGGATTTAEYKSWIDGVAAGIGGRDATVILEPDGLGIIPWYTTINGELEWCRPAEASGATAASDRFEQLNYAVDVLKAGAETSVYLDGTHSGWLGVGDISDRLIRAGVERADGFFLNASNYVATERLQKYGTWISQCIDLSVNTWWEPAWCASQYYPANPNDFSTWGLTDAEYVKAYADTGWTADPDTMAHFVVDTSRNGQGPWTPPADASYPVPEDWCNPPDRGVGALPTTAVDDPLIDAFLWIKVPGESDGKCYRGTPGPLDPERGMEDPAAGQWFVEQARELIAYSNPTLAPLDCNVALTSTKTGKGFVTGLAVQNNGDDSVTPWMLSWTYRSDQVVDSVAGGSFTQIGAEVTVTSSRPDAKAGQGKNPTVTVKGTGSAAVPWLFHLNGKACTSG